jgi:hypothetical protein
MRDQILTGFVAPFDLATSLVMFHSVPHLIAIPTTLTVRLCNDCRDGSSIGRQIIMV